MESLVQLVIVGLAAAVSAIVWKLKRRAAIKRVKLLEARVMCMMCDSTDVTREFGRVRCNLCGTVTGDALLAAPVSPDEIRALTRPDAEPRY